MVLYRAWEEDGVITTVVLSTVQFGDYDHDIYQPGFFANEQLLPQRVSPSRVICL